MQKISEIEKFKFEFLSLIDSNMPIIKIISDDIISIEQLLQNHELVELDSELSEILKDLLFRDEVKDTILFIDNIKMLDENNIISLIKQIVKKKLTDVKFNLTIVIYLFDTNELDFFPKAFEQFSYSLILEAPNIVEIINILDEFHNFIGINFNNLDEKNNFANILLGFSRTTLKLFLSKLYQTNGSINLNREYLIKEKTKYILNSSMHLKYLEIDKNITFSTIGGLYKIKDFIQQDIIFLYKKNKFKNKIILFNGVSGSGKKSIVFATANLLQLPIFYINSAQIQRENINEILKNIKYIKIGLFLFCLDTELNLINKQFLQNLKTLDIKIYTFIIAENQENIKIFDKYINFILPDKFERGEIFKIYINKILKNSSELEIWRFIENSENFSGKQIEETINRSVEIATFENRKKIETKDILLAINELKVK